MIPVTTNFKPVAAGTGQGAVPDSYKVPILESPACLAESLPQIELALAQSDDTASGYGEWAISLPVPPLNPASKLYIVRPRVSIRP